SQKTENTVESPKAVQQQTVREQNTQPQNTQPQAVIRETLECDIVESGSSMWYGGRLGALGETAFDIDNDGTKELLLADPGPSDGEFRLMITAAENDGSYKVKYQSVYQSPICKADFVEKDGKTVLEYRRYQDEKNDGGSHYEDPAFFDEPHYFDIELDGETIKLTENGEPFVKVTAIKE
ncbi:MAG: hypothetical protein IJL89_07685, partial [Firmicutes bacterium]|nr:hypothetical protein [Bacillota bacterium]